MGHFFVFCVILIYSSFVSFSSAGVDIKSVKCIDKENNQPTLEGGSYCGPLTLLQVKLDTSLDEKQASALLGTNTNINMQQLLKVTAKDGFCQWINNKEIELTNAKVLSYNITNKRLSIELNTSLEKMDFGNTKDPFLCLLQISSSSSSPLLTIEVNTKLSEDLIFFPPEFQIANISMVINDTSSKVFGIGETIGFQLETMSKDQKITEEIEKKRSRTLFGTCIINLKTKVEVVKGFFKYQVQQFDKEDLIYTCDVMDGAKNQIRINGQLTKTKIDGSIPTMEEMFMIFCADKPAHIGSVLSITIRAKNLTRGYHGKCKVNGVPELDLLEAEDHGFYMTQYVVQEKDASILNGNQSKLPIECIVSNQVGNTLKVSQNVLLGFEIDTERPLIETTSLLFASDRPAMEGSIIEIQMTLIKPETKRNSIKVFNDTCLVNHKNVAKTFTKTSDHTFLITYVMGSKDAAWKAGKLPIYCIIQDEAGNTAVTNGLNDGNTLFARELKPMEFDRQAVFSSGYLPDKKLIMSFFIVAIASNTIAKACPLIGLPSISGYLLTGIVVGPYVLNFLSSSDLRHLRVIDDISLAYIGLTAGSKLHWKQMKPILKNILFVTIGLTFFEYLIGTLTITILAGYIDFLRKTSQSEKYAIALLAGCMMIARSPSSALAVIEETKSNGHFTTLIFAVTVFCDILVICLFNVNSMVTESFLAEKKISWYHLLQLLLQLICSISMGVFNGKFVMNKIIFFRPIKLKRKSVASFCLQILKQICLLVYGLLIFLVSHLIFHPFLEPLLCCMVSGAVLYNFNPNPEELEILLKKLAPLVYVCFFTITGATLELDMLAKAMVLSIILCITRIAGIFAGSFLGGIAAGEDRTHCNVAWMAYITQAGVTLGLAKQIQLLYPGWGSYFATMIVAVVICNQLLGPPLLRFVLRFVGDAKKRQVGKVDGLQAMLLGNFDVCESAIQRLECCGWKVFHFDLATVHAASETMKEEEEVEEVEAEVHGLLSKHEPLDCVIVMMRTDEDNFHIIRALAKACHQMKRISVLRVVVHVVGKSNNSGDENMKWSTKFAEMPSTEAYGDTIDVIVVDRSEATDMLIELAACGKVINSTAILPADTTLDVNPKSIMRRPNPVALSLQEDMVPMDVSDGIDQPTTAESRKSFRRKIRHMMLV